jgi:multiple sugar transport system ATP-binding protein
MSLADRIVVMNDGVLQQIGTPTDVYLHPANLFVAQFIGSPVMNIAPASIRDAEGKAQVVIDSESFDLPRELLNMLQGKAANDLSLGIRPEGIVVSNTDSAGFRPAEAHIVQPFGGFDIVDLKIGGRTLRARTAAGYVRKAGDKVWAKIDPAHAHFFDNKSGASLDIRLGD